MNKKTYLNEEVDRLHIKNCIDISDLIITVGISGSGKSHIAKKICDNTEFKDINIDKYRKEITGDINDLSQDTEIFDIAFKNLISLLDSGSKVIWSNTSCNHHYLNELLYDVRKCLKYEKVITLLFLEDSDDIDTCRSRIKRDILTKTERANVSRKILEHQQSGYNIVKNAFIEEPEYGEGLADKHYVNLCFILTDEFDKHIPTIFT